MKRMILEGERSGGEEERMRGRGGEEEGKRGEDYERRIGNE